MAKEPQTPTSTAEKKPENAATHPSKGKETVGKFDAKPAEKQKAPVKETKAPAQETQTPQEAEPTQEGQENGDEEKIGQFKAKSKDEERDNEKAPGYQPLDLGNETNVADWFIGMMSGRLNDWFMSNLDLVGYWTEKGMKKVEEKIEKASEKDPLISEKDKDVQLKNKGKPSPAPENPKEEKPAQPLTPENPKEEKPAPAPEHPKEILSAKEEAKEQKKEAYKEAHETVRKEKENAGKTTKKKDGKATTGKATKGKDNKTTTGKGKGTKGKHGKGKGSKGSKGGKKPVRKKVTLKDLGTKAKTNVSKKKDVAKKGLAIGRKRNGKSLDIAKTKSLQKSISQTYKRMKGSKRGRSQIATKKRSTGRNE